MIRRLSFFASAALLGLSAFAILSDALLSRDGYGCMGPPSLVFMPPFAFFGVGCLAVAANRRERVKVAFVLALGTLASALILSRPSGYSPAWDGGAIGDVRTVISAEAAYESVNGYYDTLQCLATPSACIPKYSPTAPTFLDPRFAQAEPYRRYRRWLVPGSPATDAPVTSSRTSIRRFAYVAVPIDPALRSFCVDDTGVIVQAPKGITPTVRDGHCDDARFTPLK